MLGFTHTSLDEITRADEVPVQLIVRLGRQVAHEILTPNCSNGEHSALRSKKEGINWILGLKTVIPALRENVGRIAS